MAHNRHVEFDPNEQFVVSPRLRRNLLTIIVIGIVFTIIGLLQSILAPAEHGSGHHGNTLGSKLYIAEHHPEHEPESHGTKAIEQDKSHDGSHQHHMENSEHHGSPVWLKRLKTNLWINNIYFIGLSVIGVFFFAIQYVAAAGWSVVIKRIPLAFGNFLWIGALLMIVVFLFSFQDIFHWAHTYYYDKSSSSFDEILDGKKGMFFYPGVESPSIPYFFILRMVVFLGVWYLFFNSIKRDVLLEDEVGGTKIYRKLVRKSGLFIIFFGLSSSIAAWDWIMSIDTHWFSTMFGWYTFAGWFISGLAAITLVVITLKEMGYLKVVNENHLHDLGKYVFAFSIFWTYVWFCQYLLIYYANIPEESVYFLERFERQYGKLMFLNPFLNFVFPFLALMTRDSKRKITILKIVCYVVMFGHWLDNYMMITPGVMMDDGTYGFLELGLTLIYAGIFFSVVFNSLSKHKLIAKNHPMLEESLNHVVY